jgi:hypothetical protein
MEPAIDDNFTPEQIDAMLAEGSLERLGMGSRRACYALPGGRFCVKCYRSDEEIEIGRQKTAHTTQKPLRKTVRREIARSRHSERLNTSCQEFRYWRSLGKRLPAGLMAAFPSTMRAVRLPRRGWCVIEERLSNADGSPVRTFHEEWLEADSAARAKLLAALESLAAGLERHAVMFYDPQNILVQRCGNGRFRLRITDFEPAQRTLFAIDRVLPLFARLKLRRRMLRYRRMFGLFENPARRQIGGADR